MLALLLESVRCVVVCQKMSNLIDPVLIKEACSKNRQEVRGGSPYSTRHAVQGWVLPCPGKAKVTDLDEGRLLTIKQCVVQFHVTAVGRSTDNIRCHDFEAQSTS